MAAIVADHLSIPLKGVDLHRSVARDGDLLDCMTGLKAPGGYTFYHAFAGMVREAGNLNVTTLLTGHMGDSIMQADYLDAIRAELHTGPMLGRLPRAAF